MYIWCNGAMFVWVGAADVAPLSDGRSYKITDVAVFLSAATQSHLCCVPSAHAHVTSVAVLVHYITCTLPQDARRRATPSGPCHADQTSYHHKSSLLTTRSHDLSA